MFAELNGTTGFVLVQEAPGQRWGTAVTEQKFLREMA
jgi:hypothetical protein